MYNLSEFSLWYQTLQILRYQPRTLSSGPWRQFPSMTATGMFRSPGRRTQKMRMEMRCKFITIGLVCMSEVWNVFDSMKNVQLWSYLLLCSELVLFVTRGSVLPALFMLLFLTDATFNCHISHWYSWIYFIIPLDIFYWGVKYVQRQFLIITSFNILGTNMLEPFVFHLGWCWIQFDSVQKSPSGRMHCSLLRHNMDW